MALVISADFLYNFSIKMFLINTLAIDQVLVLDLISFYIKQSVFLNYFLAN